MGTCTLLTYQASRERLWWYCGLMVIILELSMQVFVFWKCLIDVLLVTFIARNGINWVFTIAKEGPMLWRRANVRNVRPYYPYWHYTELFIFWIYKRLGILITAYIYFSNAFRQFLLWLVRYVYVVYINTPLYNLKHEQQCFIGFKIRGESNSGGSVYVCVCVCVRGGGGQVGIFPHQTQGVRA